MQHQLKSSYSDPFYTIQLLLMNIAESDHVRVTTTHEREVGRLAIGRRNRCRKYHGASEYQIAVTIREDGTLTIDVYQPDETRPARTVIYRFQDSITATEHARHEDVTLPS